MSGCRWLANEETAWADGERVGGVAGDGDRGGLQRIAAGLDGDRPDRQPAGARGVSSDGVSIGAAGEDDWIQLSGRGDCDRDGAAGRVCIGPRQRMAGAHSVGSAAGGADIAVVVVCVWVVAGWCGYCRNMSPSCTAGLSCQGERRMYFRCIWSLGTWLWAVPATLVGLSLRRMDTVVQQQAVLDGALLRITLRQLLGPIVASVAIVTVLATQEFAVYEPTGISVVATEVRMVFDTWKRCRRRIIRLRCRGFWGRERSRRTRRDGRRRRWRRPLLCLLLRRFWRPWRCGASGNRRRWMECWGVGIGHGF